MNVNRKVGPIRHAPWSRWFKTFYCKGAFAYELQVGPLVFQAFYAPRRIKVWRDRYWRMGV